LRVVGGLADRLDVGLTGVEGRGGELGRAGGAGERGVAPGLDGAGRVGYELAAVDDVTGRDVELVSGAERG
jgi:hypothetical protein